MEIKKEIGKRLREARENARLTQKDAADRIGIHHSTLGKYELGVREADNETLIKIADLYEVKVEWLLKGFNSEEDERMDLAKKIVAHAGEPESNKRELFADIFFEEFSKLPNETQKAIYDLVKSLRRSN